MLAPSAAVHVRVAASFATSRTGWSSSSRATGAATITAPRKHSRRAAGTNDKAPAINSPVFHAVLAMPNASPSAPAMTASATRSSNRSHKFTTTVVAIGTPARA